MELSNDRIREHLDSFDFKALLLDIGWDNLQADSFQIEVDSISYNFQPVAQKRGVQIFQCQSGSDGIVPPYSTRAKIDRKLTGYAHEHMIIFIDSKHTQQIWRWSSRQAGKPIIGREVSYNQGSFNENLVQRLRTISFSLADEETLTLFDAVESLRAAFDKDRITRRFYDYFKSEHDAFQKMVEGIPDDEMEAWYVSVMLNRLMFIYFIQKKGFLDNDLNYLGNKLVQSEQLGKDLFYSDFLCPLFFEGFAKKEEHRSQENKDKLGSIPYLDGGLFLRHQIEEQHGEKIKIPDSAFEKIFAFFDCYQWHLDDRPLRDDREINPDVLGYIFEKYINQKQMGAYYTKEDITEYITRSTVIPCIVDKVKEKYPQAFEGANSIWQLAQEDPNRYIFEAVKKGIDLELPNDIAVGINNISMRIEWNKVADAEYALPTEIWREVVSRRQRYQEVFQKLANGEIQDINDFITYNLDIRQFLQDAIDTSEDPRLIWTIFEAIRSMTILDPTCGSGAFLFAALNVLEPLYDAGLGRVAGIVDEVENLDVDLQRNFESILAQIAAHPNRTYFIYKTIILNNLFGVDIMEEAVEICKLRLFLKLIAQIDNVEKLEPLPDIDFNVCAGNTLVGYTSLDSLKMTMNGRIDLFNELEAIENKAMLLDAVLDEFRKAQITIAANEKSGLKEKVRMMSSELEEDLDRKLAADYGVNCQTITRKNDLENAIVIWKATHKPFHWFIKFHSMMSSGGFNVIIGNPPYVEYTKVRDHYQIIDYETNDCGNLYAFIIERNNKLINARGRSGMIIPHSAICTDRMGKIVNILTEDNSLWVSTFDIRPSKLFDGVDQRLAIYLFFKTEEQEAFSSKYERWSSAMRPSLFAVIKYACISRISYADSLVKADIKIIDSIWNKIHQNSKFALSLVGESYVYYHNAPRYWIRAMTFLPYFWNERDGERISSQVRVLTLPSYQDAEVVAAALNSSLFYWWFISLSDCRHLNIREIERFPINIDKILPAIRERLVELSRSLMDNYKMNSVRKECTYQSTGSVVYDEFRPKFSKPIIDEIDRALSEHYGFSDEELDYIINFDIKFRMGINGDSDEEE